MSLGASAWFFSVFQRYINYVTGPNKRAAIVGLGSSRIVEIGSGVGANIAYLAPASKLIAIDPNRAMHEGSIAALLHQAGLSSVEMSRPKPYRSFFWMVNTQIHGITVR